MNLRFLRTVVAVSQYPTFVAAGEAMGLSHSAVSVHIKTLEDELQITLVDRKKRPPVLTDRGIALVEHAQKIFEIVDDIKSLTHEETLIGSITMGVVPSTLVNLVPPAIASLRAAHPKLHIKIKTGLSADLAQQVRNRDLDMAVVTEPDRPLANLRAQVICTEPLQLLAPKSAQNMTEKELFANYQFIWFNRQTWAGQQIERHILDRKIHVESAMEVSALEAVESLVRHGIGISVVPQQMCAPKDRPDLTVRDFGSQDLARKLIMLDRNNNPRRRLSDALFDAFQNVISSGPDAQNAITDAPKI
ncbi:LysR family transcriptional regulator [Parasedimentitalea maritima]|uniref:LysR family transcriptional regulator n=1 Tax=Parasedimentitalea maritima TaxID=2578117 RepID=A0ABY2UTB8_9RHOB|nr:LysR substrate-binding domain-containing protein [Zongyanglinia marina]TLP61615.1 LysR family transcriptional regulator [Zongyanglinia marina]